MHHWHEARNRSASRLSARGYAPPSAAGLSGDCNRCGWSNEATKGITYLAASLYGEHPPCILVRSSSLSTVRRDCESGYKRFSFAVTLTGRPGAVSAAGGVIMRSTYIIAVIAVLLPITAAESRARFVAYEGKDAISEGRGGTKVSAHGVDFWTTGEPPRRFQVLGILTDNRGEGWFSGDAVGSGSIAKKVQELGGDAIILLNHSSRVTGYVHGGNVTSSGGTAYGSGWSAPVSRATTQMVVVKYLGP